MFKKIIKSRENDNNSENVIANRYELQYVLGKGAMGKVYCASDRTSGGTNVAIKFLSQTLLDEQMRSRFEKEAKISALLGEQSNHIVKVKDYGLDSKKVPYYVMEILQGDSLDKMIKKRALSIGKFLSLTRQICLALECAHNGILVDGELRPIIHRDIKPNNVFIVQQEGQDDLVKILDFGIAEITESGKSKNEMFMGTPQYCAPEQLAEQELDHRCDIYSLGVMMYEMLTGEPPIKTENHSFQGWYQAHHHIIPKPLPRYLNLPKDLENIIMRCLEKKPENRPQRVLDILKVINPLEREYNSPTPQPTPQPTSGTTPNAKSTPQKPPTSQAPPRPKHTPVDKSTTGRKAFLPLQQIYLQSSWPSDKPRQKIVFPAVTESKEGTFASLWTMLEPQLSIKFNPNETFCYNHFLGVDSPHPMLLWVNLLYSRKGDLKWLPCYLDLQTELAVQILINLIEHQMYHILLFSLNNPQQYQEILKVSITPLKCQQIDNFLQKSSYWKGKPDPEASKKILREKFEQVKVTILKAIERAT